MGGAKNCPETPRQKMIGMMYLVLTAMLALNVSAAILNGYTQVDDSLHSTIETIVGSNENVYAQFNAALEKNPEKTQEWYDKAMLVKEKSDEFYNYVQNFKDEMVQMADGSKAKPNAKVRDIGKKDDTNIPQRYAINDGHAAVLKAKVIEYRDFLEDITGDAEVLDTEIDATFNVGDCVNADGEMVSWEIATFHEMPMCASITVLTKLQNDVRNCEGKTIQFLLDATDAGDLRVNKFNAYVIPASDYVIRGSKYTAQIILAAIDSTQAPEYYVNGQRIGNNGVYEVIANSVGMQKVTGKIGYMDQQGVMQYLPFEREYTVGEPSATISNTDLNIMYRGYDNPFSISVPGVSAHKLRVECKGAAITQNSGHWIIKPGGNAPENMTIEVYANLNGKEVLMGSHIYRVKNLPRPDAYFEINGVPTEEMRISRSQLLNPKNRIVASYGADGLVQANFKITGFQVKLPTGASFSIKGDHIDSKALAAIAKLGKGNVVNIRYIKAIGPDGKEMTLRGLPLELN